MCRISRKIYFWQVQYSGQYFKLLQRIEPFSILCDDKEGIYKTESKWKADIAF